MKEMIEVERRRLANVRTLAMRYDTQTDCAVALGMTKSGLSQLIGPTPIRGITERMARKFETRLRLAPGTLDQDPKSLTGIPDTPSYAAARVPKLDAAHDTQVLDKVMREVDAAIFRLGAALPNEKYRPLVTHLYGSAMRSGGHVDAFDVENVVRLIS